MCTYAYKGERVEKSVVRYVHTKRMTPSKCCRFLSNGPIKYMRVSLPARKMPLLSSIIITIVLSYAIIRIYRILHIYLQVTERVELVGWQNCIK